ncbi:hypothetical protein FHU41_001042 [Psychromicrobium silvestre]|uniref:FMN-binding domain-containing protein n=1 Tax=Psychromicrobium silvestre TaxID=1645614 RepID=A0A7Y9S6W1_9MICC|nr:hypothetical protein [Psychromicrobium silvestre]NYE94821.1 hypothetical protein [Psychromicrobium silvestre]
MRTTTRKTMFLSAAGIALVGGVTACAPTASQPSNAANQDASSQSTSSQQSSSNASSSSSGTSGTSGTSSYQDGSYSADGHYVSPNGEETIGVKLTLASGVITDLQLTPHPTSPNTQQFQGEFISGINAIVVGKKIDELNVSKVAGSSLTSGGFNQAITEIEKEASK